MPRRYNTAVSPPHSNGVVLFGHISVVQEARDVFEEMAKHLSEILWPPTMHISNKLCTTSIPTVQFLVDKSIQSYSSPPSCCHWDTMLYWKHREWPPPTVLQLVNCEVVLHPLPCSSFQMVEGNSVTGCTGRLWKPPWYVAIQQTVRCMLDELVEPWDCMMMASVSIQIAAMLPLVGQKFGIGTCNSLPQLPWMTFDLGSCSSSSFTVFPRVILYSIHCSYSLIEGEPACYYQVDVDKSIHTQSPIGFLSYAFAKKTVTTSVQLFFQYFSSGLEYVLAKPTYALEGGLSYGLELCDTRNSSGNYNKQWQLIFVQLVIKQSNGWFADVFQLSGQAKEISLQHGDCFSVCRAQLVILELFGVLLGGHRKLLLEVRLSEGTFSSGRGTLQTLPSCCSPLTCLFTDHVLHILHSWCSYGLSSDLLCTKTCSLIS